MLKRCKACDREFRCPWGKVEKCNECRMAVSGWHVREREERKKEREGWKGAVEEWCAGKGCRLRFLNTRSGIRGMVGVEGKEGEVKFSIGRGDGRSDVIFRIIEGEVKWESRCGRESKRGGKEARRRGEGWLLGMPGACFCRGCCFRRYIAGEVDTINPKEQYYICCEQEKHISQRGETA